MTASTHGLRLRTGSHALRTGVELLSSMRFAIALLTVICIASVIGTVLRQNEPLANYINQFGPFWAQVFLAARLDAVYSAWWFLLILAFLVVSTSLCIARNTPRILAGLRDFKENIRVQGLKAFGLCAQGPLDEAPEAAARRIGRQLAGGGWKVKLQHRQGGAEDGWMVAARAGGANKWGYLAAHGAIVLICLGGLLDGELVVRAQTWFSGKSVYHGGGLIADVPARHRLPASNPTFRGNILVPEGGQSSVAILNQGSGVLLQELPFAIELKKFIVDYYSTGMPKLFASEVLLHDRATGETRAARIEVNHPASWKGVQIYQSSFDDGGSKVKLRAVPMNAGGRGFDLDGAIGGSTELSDGSERLTLEYTALRVINVENFAGAQGSGADVRKVDLRSHLGSAAAAGKSKDLRNVGPSIGYKLRDASGQAREFQNYMVPVAMEEGGPPVFLLGVREQPDQPFRYLRVPADEQGSMAGYLHLRDALADDGQRRQAVDRYVARVLDPARKAQVQQLRDSSLRALDLFAGAERIKPAAGAAAPRSTGGWQAIAEFIDLQVPEAERERAGQVLVRVVNEVLFELLNLSRERAGQAPLPMDDQGQAWLTQAVLALSDAPFYPAPVALMLTGFDQVQASVFQVARAPGRNVVYLGCALLIVGIFAMLYVRERRLWVWIAPAAGGGSGATLALSSNRRNLDTGREFAHLRRRLLGDETPAAETPTENSP
ncbi:MAG: cytochrome c biogenesis protein ResB [Xenophilus sp.]